MLAENSTDLHADVLKVGHHGSKNSTTQEFLNAVAPAIAIISSGEDNALRTSQLGIAGTIRSEWGAGVENRSGWSGAFRYGWRPARDFLVRGVPRIGDCDYFKGRGRAKS